MSLRTGALILLAVMAGVLGFFGSWSTHVVLWREGCVLATLAALASVEDETASPLPH